MPLLFTAADMAEWAHETSQVPFTKDETYTMCSRVGRNESPALLLFLHMYGKLQPAAYHLVGDIWSTCEYPMDYLRQVDWLELFAASGFTIDDQPAERPTETMTLYRGSPARLRRRWSWTSSRDEAERFATGRLRGRPVGSVWRAEVEPWRLLTIQHDRGESEYVIQTKGLKIVQDLTPTQQSD